MKTHIFLILFFITQVVISKVDNEKTLSFNTGNTETVSELNYTNQSQYNDIPNDPTNLSLSNITDRSIDLTWEDNCDNECSFYIERKTGIGGSWEYIFHVVANRNTCTDDHLSPNTDYCYKQNAQDYRHPIGPLLCGWRGSLWLVGSRGNRGSHRT